MGRSDTGLTGFVRWLNEMFAEVRITNFAVLLKGGELVLEDSGENIYSVVAWGVQEEFYKRVVERQAQKIAGSVFGWNRGRFYLRARTTEVLNLQDYSLCDGYVSARVVNLHVEPYVIKTDDSR
jgi:hypothetical protein